MAKSANISANASVHQPIRESHGKLAHSIREGRINFRYTEIQNANLWHAFLTY